VLPVTAGSRWRGADTSGSGVAFCALHPANDATDLRIVQSEVLADFLQLNRAVSFQPPASSGGKSATWRILPPISGSPLGEETNGGKQCQDKAFSWLLVAGSSF